MSLRPYQTDCLQTAKNDLAARINRQLHLLPTGTGKTVIFANLREFFGFQKRILVLVHREELADQAAAKIRKWGKGRVGIEMGERSCSYNDQTVVASVQTIGRKNSTRLAQFRPDDFDAVVIDEAHHATADTYLNVINHFGFNNPDCTRLLMGVTATGNRADGQGLAKVFDKISYQMSILDAINQGWLTDIRGVRISTKANLDDVHTVAGDFQQDELSLAVNSPERNDLIVREWLNKAQERQTVCFTVDIAHAKALAEAYKGYGVAAEAIWGNDPERAAKLAAHKRGGLKVLSNCGVLIEGYDDAAISCVVMARPTKSQLLFIQQAGRGLRIPEGVHNLKEAKQAGVALSKTDCLLIDVADNTSKHSLISLPSIFGMWPQLDLDGTTVTEAIQRIETVQAEHPNANLSGLTDLAKLEAYAQQVDLFKVTFTADVEKHSLLQWHRTPAGNYCLLLPNNEHVVIAPNLLEKCNVWGTVNGNSFDSVCDDLPEAFRWADEMVGIFGGRNTVSLLKRVATWGTEGVTVGQERLIKWHCSRLGWPRPDTSKMTKGDAHLVIGKMEAALLQKRGIGAK